MTDKGFKCPPPQKKEEEITKQTNNKKNNNKKFACSCIKLCFMLPN